MDDVFGDVLKALADPQRRLLLDRLNARNGQTLRELCTGLDTTRQAVSKHLAVLEADPPRRLSYTWHTFTPEWAAAVGVDEELRARIAAERRSRVSFDLEPEGALVKLTVVHDDFDEGSTVAEMIKRGWPRLLGAIKTLLEAGGSDEEGFGLQVTSPASSMVLMSPRRRGQPPLIICATVLPSSKSSCTTVSLTSGPSGSRSKLTRDRRSAAIFARSSSSTPTAAAHSGAKVCQV